MHFLQNGKTCRYFNTSIPKSFKVKSPSVRLSDYTFQGIEVYISIGYAGRTVRFQTFGELSGESLGELLGELLGEVLRE